RPQVFDQRTAVAAGESAAAVKVIPVKESASEVMPAEESAVGVAVRESAAIAMPGDEPAVAAGVLGAGVAVAAGAIAEL
ncbi:MAG TPA: hypothetical protein VGG23_07790, partial [Acidimicrobiales bacterium]